jgi:hypothetical protein
VQALFAEKKLSSSILKKYSIKTHLRYSSQSKFYLKKNDKAGAKLFFELTTLDKLISKPVFGLLDS